MLTGFCLGLALGLAFVVIYDLSIQRWHTRARVWFEGAQAFDAEREQWKADVTKLLDAVRDDLRKVGWSEREQQAAKLTSKLQSTEPTQ